MSQFVKYASLFLMEKKKVFVGMSGGVDSSVSALLLKESGYDVTGVFIKVWQADFLPCTWREERRDAMRACAHLGIPFLTLDLEKAYKEEVVDYMIREYSAGRVPNPDVMCNKHVKFGAFLDFAKKHGAHFIATGHYARIEQFHVMGHPYTYRLLAGVDAGKDQSYFLWTLTQEQLLHTFFPVGHLKKSEVRELARRADLPTAEKKDSQGLCFMGAVDMKEFLRHYITTKKGAVLDTEGRVIGEHDGAPLYAIGERHGFSTKKSSPNEQPLRVMKKDMEKNTITVAPDAPSGTSVAHHIALSGINDISGELFLPRTGTTEVFSQIRYHGARYRSTFTPGKAQMGVVEIPDITEAVSAGQSLVFYRGDTCLGGGVIA